MIRHLERNEKVVSWLQPRDGCVEDQQPAVRFKSHFYTLSLRMMKSIWRHVSTNCCFPIHKTNDNLTISCADTSEEGFRQHGDSPIWRVQTQDSQPSFHGEAQDPKSFQREFTPHARCGMLYPSSLLIYLNYLPR